MWIQAFIDYLRLEKNSSERTVESYQAALEEFEQFWKQVGVKSWDVVDSDLIRDWVVVMMDRGNSASTVNARLSALRSFYRFLLRRKMVTIDPAHRIVGPKKEKKLPNFVKESEIDSLLDGEAVFPNNFVGIRDRLILLMFYSTGIRLGELVGLNVYDINCFSQQLRVTGKRNKQRIIPFGRELRDAVDLYLSERLKFLDEKSETKPFFVEDETCQRIKPDKVRKIVQKYLSMVTTLKKKSPHVLRHSFATSMLNHHADLQSVKELLGHESLSTTEIYTHTSFEELKEMYTHAHPRA